MTTLYGKQSLEVLRNSYEQYETLADNEQVKVNHVFCGMGEDTKERLYIKRTNGSYLWHCHNCGDSGFYRNNVLEQIASREAKTGLVYKKEPNFNPYFLAEPRLENFSLEHQLWLLQYEFDEEIVSKCGIHADKDKGIFLPIWDSTATLAGFQIRQFNRQPKYLTYTTNKYSHMHSDNEVLIITEDLMSAYKLRIAGYSTLALLGTKLHPEAVDLLTKYKYNRIVVWLDDDSAGHRGMKDIMSYLSPVVKNMSSMGLTQPKELSFAFLETLNLRGT
jgi:hypothetical protein